VRALNSFYFPQKLLKQSPPALCPKSDDESKVSREIKIIKGSI
jgi:hypothetical protein